jgi:hypothetical protein
MTMEAQNAHPIVSQMHATLKAAMPIVCYQIGLDGPLARSLAVPSIHGGQDINLGQKASQHQQLGEVSAGSLAQQSVIRASVATHSHAPRISNVSQTWMWFWSKMAAALCGIVGEVVQSGQGTLS